MIGFLGLIALLSYDVFVQIGLAGILPLLPFAALWLLVPLVPIFVYNHFRTADLIRNGDERKGRLRLRPREKKAEENA